MHLRKTFFDLYFIQNIFYLCVKIKKLPFSKIIVLTYFDTVKYLAVEKIEFLQRERGLTYRGLIKNEVSSPFFISNEFIDFLEFIRMFKNFQDNFLQ